MTISVALLRFTPPEGMPWIKCVPPTEVEKVVKGLIPDANVWVVPDAADVDTKAENGPSEGGKSESTLEKALRWAAGKRKEEDEIEQANLVVLAGSLYLVADFYRFLDQLIDTMV
jgi:folylpolyglutamate synthase